jgi:galacturan 1,4-alpha-galacturonidase
MRYLDKKVSDINIAYIGGGSRGWAWGLMSDLADEETMSGTMRLFDIDYHAAQNNAVIGNSIYDRENIKGKWKYQAVKTIEEALSGADFVVMSIVPGTFKEMESDVHAPEKYGIYQAVGDTVGPGGCMRAMRTIPLYRNFAKKIRECCPDAWIINYTNPMTICTRTLYEEFPEIKAFGCCHEVFSTQMLFSDVLEKSLGIKDIQREEIRVNVLGINHFTWLDKASYKGIDILPYYAKFVDEHIKDGYYDSRQKKRDPEEMKFFGCHNLVKFDLYKKFGLVAAAGDRHLAEFVPRWYIDTPETVASWKFALTPMSYRRKQLDERIEKAGKLASGSLKFEIVKTGEDGVRQIKALVGLNDLVTNVNLPNRGQIDGIPAGSVVETNAVFSKNGIQPVVAGKLPLGILNLVMRHVLNQETIVKGAFAGNVEEIFRAFLNDPLVSHLKHEMARKLFDEMTSNTKAYLKDYKL